MKSAYEFVCMSYKDTCGGDYFEKYLHPYELEKIKKAVDKRKLEFLYGRLCGKLAYARLCGTNIFDSKLCIYEDYCGAPYFDDGAFRVSITHDAGLAAAVVTKRGLLRAGIDVQKLSSESTGVIYQFLSDSEKEIFDKQSGEYGKDFLAASLWVAKESLSKLLEYGFSVYGALETAQIEKDGGLKVRFKKLGGFSVLLRPYKDYIFGFAAMNKDIDNFSEDNLVIEETQI